MAFLQKRFGKNWYVVDKSGGRVIYSRSTKTGNQREAYKKLAEYEAVKARGLKEMHMLDFIAVFRRDSIGRTARVLDNYSLIGRRFAEISGNKPLTRYTTHDIDKFVSHISDTRSQHTAHWYRRGLSTIFETAVTWDYCLANPVKRSQRIKLPESDIKFFTKEQFKRLMDAIDRYSSPFITTENYSESKEKYKDLFLFLVLSGLRFNEVRHLKPEHIDTERRLIMVLSDAEHSTKTGMTRYVELNKLLLPVVKKYRHNKYVFTGSRDGEKLNNVWCAKVLRKFLKFAGLPEVLNIKAMRSTFGMWLLNATGNIKYVQQQLGHSSVRTTERHYAKYINTEFTGLTDQVKL